MSSNIIYVPRDARSQLYNLHIFVDANNSSNITFQDANSNIVSEGEVSALIIQSLKEMENEGRKLKKGFFAGALLLKNRFLKL